MTLFVKDRSFYRLVLSLSLPIAMQNLITTGVSMMDTIMIGALGEFQLSGAALANQVAFIFMVLNFGIASGAGVLTAQYWGKRDTESIRRIMAVMYRLSLGVACLFMIGSLAFPSALMHIFSNEPEVIAEGVKYLQIIAFTYIMYGITITTIGVLRTVGTVSISLAVYSISFVVNVFANWVFIYGNLGAPRLEVRGAALGTLIARIVECTVVVLYLLLREKKIGFRAKDLFMRSPKHTAEYGRTASPVVLNELLWSVGASMTSIVLGKMGAVAVAANSICQVVVQFVSVFLQGVGSSAAVIIGNTVGEGRYEDAQKRAETFVTLALLLGLIAGGMILLVRPFAISMYNVTDLTKEMAVSIMDVAAGVVVFQSISLITMVGTLRGGGDVKFVLVNDVVFLWAIAIPFGFLTGLYWKLPVVIVYACIKSDELLKSVFCIWRIYSRKWIRNLTV